MTVDSWLAVLGCAAAGGVQVTNVYGMKRDEGSDGMCTRKML